MILTWRTHYNAMVYIMDYCFATPERGLAVIGMELVQITNLKLQKMLDARRSMTESVVYLNGVLVMFRSSIQKTVSLLSTKAELNVAVMGKQDALFVKNIMKSLGLKVKLPTLASIDNSRAVDIGNS